MCPGLSQKKLKPGLYLVATPIGNLTDMTTRGRDILAAADLVLCEDTRVTGKLLSHLGIRVPLQVYNDQSEKADFTPLLDRIKAGQMIALVSDAGMPLVSDPGYKLVQACQQADVMVTSAPGANAILTALQLSGLPPDTFLFGGFLPHKKGDRRARFQELAAVPATLIFFERASRAGAALQDAADILGRDRMGAVARELTKLFEEVRQGTLSDLVADLERAPIKGEVVLVISRGEGACAHSTPDMRALLTAEMKKGPLRAAVDTVVALTGRQRREVYDLALKIRDQK